MSDDRPLTDSLLALAREDLAIYSKILWPPFECPRHLDVIASRFQAVALGEHGRQIVNVPPQNGKTKLLRLLAAWVFGRRPTANVVFASYSQELADDSGREIRDLVSDPRHRAIFPESKCSDASAAAHRFSTTKGGNFVAVGRGGSLTGRGADLLLLDDTIKDLEEGRSPTICRQLHEWFQSVAFTRLSPKGSAIVVGTRWSDNDLTGWLLREDFQEGWEVLSLPAIAEAGDLLGRAEGEALWPERWPLERLARIKAQTAGAIWSTLYQQQPRSIASAIFREEWFQRFELANPPAFSRTVISLDTAFKTTSSADYSAATVWGVAPNGFFLLGAWRGRVEFPQLKAKAVELYERWGPNVVLVEDKASGQSLIQELRSGTSMPVLPVKVDADKVMRANAVSPMFESGRVFVPSTSSAPWVEEVLEELLGFPGGVHDDLVDTVTQALNYLRAPAEDGATAYYDLLHRRQHEQSPRWRCDDFACAYQPDGSA